MQAFQADRLQVARDAGLKLARPYRVTGLDLFDGFAVGRQAGVGLVKEEKVIVPFAEGFLCGLVAGGEAGGGL